MISARDLAPASDWTSLCLAFQRSKDCASFPCIPSEWSASHRECEAPFASTKGGAWVVSCKCIACRWNLPWPKSFADTNKYSVCGIRQSGKFFFDLHRGAILLCSSLRTSRRPIGSSLSLGVPVLTKFNGCLQFLGSSWHVTAVSQNAMLSCLMN